MATKTQLANDNFAGTTLNANWTIEQGGYAVASGVVRSTVGIDCGAAYNARAFPADQYANVVIANKATFTGDLGVSVRVTGTSWYALDLVNNGSWLCRKVTSGAGSNLTSGSGLTLNNGDVFEIQIIGTTIHFLQNGVQFLTQVDAGFATGAAGLGGFGNQSTGGTTVWTAGALNATSATSAGTPQSATINAAFGTNLAVTVLDSLSSPIQGVVVTFTAPASSSSGVFTDSGNNVTTATTNASGVATAAVFTANATAGGPYNVAGSVNGLADVNFALTNNSSGGGGSNTSFLTVNNNNSLRGVKH